MSEWVNEFSAAHYTISWILLQPSVQLFISPNLFTLTTISKWFILYMKQQLGLKPGGSHHPSVRANSVCVGGKGVDSCLGFYLAPLPLCALVPLFYSSSMRTHRAFASRYTTSSIIQLLFWFWVLTSPGRDSRQLTHCSQSVTGGPCREVYILVQIVHLDLAALVFWARPVLAASVAIPRDSLSEGVGDPGSSSA